VETSEDHYLQIISAKTAALFAAACRIAAVVGERDEAVEQALDAYGRNLGIAFQLIDDAIDYSSDSDTMGKGVGDDFRDGKVTLPVILAFARGDEADRLFWRDAMEGRASPTRTWHAPHASSAPRARSTTPSPRPPLRPAGHGRARPLPCRQGQVRSCRSGRVRHFPGLLMRLSGLEAQAVLREEIARFSSRIDFMMDIKSGPRKEAATIEWWRKDFVDQESATTDRNVAFLRAYTRTAGSPRLWAVGLPLADKGRVYMDRSVMRRLERDGYVRFV
jgi:hypothetical protein